MLMGVVEFHLGYRLAVAIFSDSVVPVPLTCQSSSALGEAAPR